MSKTKLLKILNEKIDKMILEGKTKTRKYKELCQLHKKLIYN